MCRTRLMSLKKRRHVKPAALFVINISITPQPGTTAPCLRPRTTAPCGREACGWRGHCGASMAAPQRNGAELPSNPAIPLLDIYAKETNSESREPCAPSPSPFTAARPQIRLQRLLTGGGQMTTESIHREGYSSAYF